MRKCCPDLLLIKENELREALARLDAAYDDARRRRGAASGDSNSVSAAMSILPTDVVRVDGVIHALRQTETALQMRALNVKYAVDNYNDGAIDENVNENDGDEALDGTGRRYADSGARKTTRRARFEKSDEEVAAVLGVSTPRAADLIRRGRKALPLVADDEPIEVLYEDSRVIAVNKPPHLRFHPIHRFKGTSLLNRVIFHLQNKEQQHQRHETAAAENSDENSQDDNRAMREQKPGPDPHVVHRLDMDTSGVAILAKDIDSARNLHEQFRERSVLKEYTAVCHGCPEEDTFVVDAPIASASEENEFLQRVTPDGRPASTRFEVMLRGADHCVMRCFPLTGRTHQIRVHLAHVGLPIIGDTLYSSGDTTIDAVADIERHALHASSLVVKNPANGQPLRIHAALPDDMSQFIARHCQ